MVDWDVQELVNGGGGGARPLLTADGAEELPGRPDLNAALRPLCRRAAVASQR